jgi:CRP-like cAMP-binding protein
MNRHRAELVAGLPAEAADAVMALGTPVRVPSGSELFHLGGPAEFVYLVERGRIILTLPMKVFDRDQQVLIEERSAGQTVGWSALIPPHRFTLTAMAPLDTDVIAIPRGALIAYFESHPDIAVPVMRNIAEVIGQRLQVFQTMWLREMQRVVSMRTSMVRGAA